MNHAEQHLPRITSSAGEQSLAKAEENSPYYVMLPCEVKDFRSFVAGLLGKPQELRGEIVGSFKIGHREITNVYHLLEQRMSKQNDSSLIHFVITVYYDDGQTVVHNNIQDFELFHPTTPCHPSAVSISATYLIKFRGHEAPEKQEIELRFDTQGEFKDVPHRFFARGSLVDYRIVHTERTWATDIAGLLKNHASTVVSKPTGAAKFVRTYADELAVYFSQLVFLVSVFVWTAFATRVIGSATVEFASIKEAAIFLIRSVPALALLGVMLVVVRTYVERTAFFYRRAHIVLNVQDAEKFDKDQKELFWSGIKYLSVWLFSLVTGVLSNILYSKNWFW
ncbi:hypothetical protein [Polaromonas sp.]|uniref:hypothetical protein n=1 Tax=Polaromonas sp. TaxID=1869339 RepID=UPI0017B46219|nr:hypothetical protein [Polaromonas sp.]NML84242.1 hypothetical protein [Polaromonas sp.]